MRSNDYDAALAYEHQVKEALFLDRCASGFARAAHGMKAIGRLLAAERERRRAGVYRHKAGKCLNAAQQYLPR